MSTVHKKLTNFSSTISAITKTFILTGRMSLSMAIVLSDLIYIICACGCLLCVSAILLPHYIYSLLYIILITPFSHRTNIDFCTGLSLFRYRYIQVTNHACAINELEMDLEPVSSAVLKECVCLLDGCMRPETVLQEFVCLLDGCVRPATVLRE